MAVNISQFFGQDIPNAFANNPTAAKQIEVKVQYVITGEGGGQWFVNASSSGPSCVAGNQGGADCTLTMSAEDFQTYRENPLSSGTQLFFSGKLKVQGNQALVPQAAKIFSV